jgi:hypothetical protein
LWPRLWSWSRDCCCFSFFVTFRTTRCCPLSQHFKLGSFFLFIAACDCHLGCFGWGFLVGFFVIMNIVWFREPIGFDRRVGPLLSDW